MIDSIACISENFLLLLTFHKFWGDSQPSTKNNKILTFWSLNVLNRVNCHRAKYNWKFVNLPEINQFHLFWLSCILEILFLLILETSKHWSGNCSFSCIQNISEHVWILVRIVTKYSFPQITKVTLRYRINTLCVY